MTMIPGTRLGAYEILAPLGAGGMGEVWLAEDTRLKRKVAIKLLPAELTADAGRVHRFEQEAQAASALNHPNIITIYDIGESEAGRFIVMELVTGRTLRAVIAEVNSTETLLKLGQQLAKALSAAHSAGITHRDIKPDNIMVRDDGYVKVLDFGLARLRAATESDPEAATLAQQTTPGTMMGTVAYMSPEQARGETFSQPSDIFALGIVFYELVTGRHPFKAETMVGYLHAITLQTPAPPRQWQPSVPDALNELILRMLNKEASQRPTASDIVQTLQALERGDETTRSHAANDRLGALLCVSDLPLAEAHDSEASGRSRSPFFNEASPSIAVLPFVNISNDPDNEYFCDGLAEEFLNALSKIEGLRVAARTSAFSFKGKETDIREIGQRLNVSAVLEGSVRKAGNRLRITAQLVNVADGYHLWSERYDREMQDIFDVQDEITLAAVDALKLRLFGAAKAVVLKRHTDNTEAYELYLKGRFFWGKVSPAGFERAIEYFNQAVAIEPNFALAYAGLADSYAILSQVSAVPVRETMPRAKEFAKRALSLDVDLAEAHSSLGLVLMDYDYDFVGAETHFKKAIKLNPNNSTARQLYGQLLAELGRHGEAEEEFRQAINVDPLSVLANCHYGFGLYESRRYHEAVIQLNRTFELDASFPLTQAILSYVHQAQGNHPEAIEGFARFYELVDKPQDAARVRKSFADGGWSGFVRMMTGKQPPADTTGYLAAALHSSLGEKDAAFAKIEEAYENREALLALIKVDPRVDGLRADPRFDEMLNRIGFPSEKDKQVDRALEDKPEMLSSSEAENDLRVRKVDRRLNSNQKTNPRSGIRYPKSKWWIVGLLSLIMLGSGFFIYRSFTTRKQIESIAVLPFVNDSSDADVEYLSDGMTETLISSLSQLPKLNVKARSSVFRYKGKDFDLPKIARELNVQAILTGRVVQRGEQLTLSLELVDAQTENVVWSEQYNRRKADLVALQSEIARDVASKLKTKLSGADEAKLTNYYTANPDAYQLYLKGRFNWARRTKENTLKAIEYYRQAIELDPTYALAYVGIANAYNTMGKDPHLAPKEAIPKAKAAAIQALDIDPALGEAHAALADSLAIFDWNWVESERGFKRALELDPNVSYIHLAYATSYLAPMKRAGEVIAEIKRSLELEPLSLISNAVLVTGYLYSRQPETALEQARKAYDLDPNFGVGRFWLGQAYMANGMFDDAIALGEDGLQKAPESPEFLFFTGQAYAKAGRQRESRQFIDRLRAVAKTKYVRTYWLACIYAALGDKDNAFAQLERSFEEKDCFLPRVSIDPAMDSLRDDPRFKALLRRLNLPE